MELEKRWNGSVKALPALEDVVGNDTALAGSGGNAGRVDFGTPVDSLSTGGRLSQAGGAGEVWEPRVMHISGHTDRYFHFLFMFIRILEN